ncbi:NosD domain-containing protein [Paenibacillus psychroresistens]|nr:right-handed parallel beta-helix repeat-containing protein [Paenibacillus psychroresistens]
MGTFNIVTYGAVAGTISPSVGTANKKAIAAAIASAIAVKGTVYIPSGTYFINSLFNNLSGTFNIEGEGPQSEIYCVEATPTNSDRRIFSITNCIGGSFKDFKVSSNAVVGTSTRSNFAWGLGLISSSQCKVEGVYIAKTFAAGLMFQSCSSIEIIGNHVTQTCADSIHMTNGCTDMIVSDNTTFDCGDDSIAVVTYTNEPYCERILIHNNILDKSWARGITVVGGKKVVISNNIVTNTASSGILTAFESGEFNTKDVFDVTIVGNQVHRAGTYFPVIPTNGNHFGIEISSGTDIIATDNNVTSSNSRGITVADSKTKRVSINNNNVKYSGSTGIYAGSVKGLGLTGNTTTMNKAQGIALIATRDVIANNNYVQNNNFWDKDSEVTTLSAAISATVNTLKFASGVNFAIFSVSFAIVIDLEQMSVTAFNSTTGNATVIRGQNGTAAAPHAAGAIITSGPRTVSTDNVLIQNCTNIVFEGNQSLEDWSVALYPDTNIHNADKTPAIKNRVERAVEFTGNIRFRVLGNLIYCGSGTITSVYFGTPNTNTDGLRDDYKGTTVPNETAFRAGQTYYKTDTDVGYVYNGSVWRGVKYTL